MPSSVRYYLHNLGNSVAFFPPASTLQDLESAMQLAFSKYNLFNCVLRIKRATAPAATDVFLDWGPTCVNTVYMGVFLCFLTPAVPESSAAAFFRRDLCNSRLLAMLHSHSPSYRSSWIQVFCKLL